MLKTLVSKILTVGSPQNKELYQEHIAYKQQKKIQDLETEQCDAEVKQENKDKECIDIQDKNQKIINQLNKISKDNENLNIQDVMNEMKQLNQKKQLLQIKQEKILMNQTANNYFSQIAQLCECFQIFKIQKKKRRRILKKPPSKTKVIDIVSQVNSDNQKALVQPGSKYRLPKPVLAQKQNVLNRKTLFVDLDETLINSNRMAFPEPDLVFKKIFQGKKMIFYVKFRPYAKEFLEEMSKYYEIIIFTASLEEYASVIIKQLDPEGKFISQCLYRENCTNYQGAYTKDMSKVNRDISKVILLDNASHSFVLQPENGLLIKSFFHFTKGDEELKNLTEFLIFLSEQNDVRNVSEKKDKFISEKFLQLKIKGIS